MKKDGMIEMKDIGSILTGEKLEWLGRCSDYREQIKILRKKMGFTQEQLANMTDHTPRSIRTIENGEAFPRITTLQQIADALDAELIISLIPRTGISGFPFEKMDKAAGDAEEDDFRIGETD